MEEVKPYRRRGARIALRLTVVFRWEDPGGGFHEELAETVLLSRHGGLGLCRARLKAGEEAFVWWPERQREARVRIVFRRIGAIADLTEVAFEFEGPDDFWQISFPSESAPWENSGRQPVHGHCRK